MSASNPRALVVFTVPQSAQQNQSSGLITQTGTPQQPQQYASPIVVTPISYKVENNAHGVLDSAEVVIPIKNNPDLAQLVVAGNSLPIAIYAGFPSNPAPGGYTYGQLSQRFVGSVDQSNPNFEIEDQTVTIPCISYGAVLTRNKTTTMLGTTSDYASVAGLTTVQFVQKVCSRFNITPDIQVANPANLQQVYTTNQIVGLQNLKYWDIILLCAQTDGTLVWFSGKTLHYRDPGTISRTLVQISYGDLVTGVESFQGQHAIQYAKNIEVEVRSYSSKETTSYRTRVRNGPNGSVTSTSYSQKWTYQNFGTPGSSSTQTSTTYNADGSSTTTSGTASSSSLGGEQSSGFQTTPNASVNERYIIKRWGLTQAQCDSLAQQIWIQLSAHEFRGTFKIPMTPAYLANYDITNKFHVTPSGNTNLPWWSSFSQDYIPLRMTEEMTIEQGWDFTVLGINHAVANGVGSTS